jgi:hypothetical protein
VGRARRTAEKKRSIGIADGSIMAIIMMLHMAPAAKRSETLQEFTRGMTIAIPIAESRVISLVRRHRSSHASAVSPAIPATTMDPSREGSTARTILTYPH